MKRTAVNTKSIVAQSVEQSARTAWPEMTPYNWLALIGLGIFLSVALTKMVYEKRLAKVRAALMELTRAVAGDTHTLTNEVINQALDRAWKELGNEPTKSA